MVGLSTRTILWRAFSQAVVFLYLMDENTSMLVLVPAGLTTLVEVRIDLLAKFSKLIKSNFPVLESEEMPQGATFVDWH